MKILSSSTYTGPNIHSYRRVIAIHVDLEEAKDTPTTEVPGFTERLLIVVPGLASHECSLGVPGGFVRRMREGTYMAHVMEHLALELQAAVGCQVSFGRAREMEQSGHSLVVYEYEVPEVGEAAGQTALQLINRLLAGEELPPREEILEPLRQLKAQYGLGATTAAIVEAALARGIPVIRIGDCSLIQLGWGAKQKRIQASTTSSTSCISVDIACDKWLTKQFLEEIGIPTPKARLVESLEGALKAAEEIEGPVVVKPASGNHGNGITVGVRSKEELQQAYALAAELDGTVLIEEQVFGDDYRLLVVGEEVVAAALRKPAAVTGDGTSTIAQLVAATNQDPRRGDGHATPLTKLALDPVSLAVLAEAGYTPGSVPAKGEVVVLRRTANLSTGGTSLDVTDEVHPEIKAMALRAVRTIGLDIAGVDLVCKDITAPLAEAGAYIIEINASPGLRMHLYPEEGQPRDVAGLIVNHLFPLGDNGRIPLIAVTGTNGKTTVTRLIRHIISLTGETVGMTTTDGIMIGEELICSGDTTGPWSTGVILKDPRVQAAVVEVARGGILRSGLGYDYSDIAVITNISADHLGQDGIDTLEDLAYVKSLVGECVKPGGYLVLNGDDPRVRAMADHSDGKPIFFTMSQSDAAIRRLGAQGHLVVACKEGRIVVWAGKKETIIASVDTIPITLQGRARHNVANVLAAVGAALGAGVPVELIKRGLETFAASAEMNQGRMNLTEINGVNILIDYGHNPAGYQAALETAQQLTAGRIIGVIGAPGDRPDALLQEVGHIAGRYLDFAIIKEDRDLRGRHQGEVAGILQSAVSKTLSLGNTSIVLDEEEAIVEAVRRADPGDLVVVFYEDWQAVTRALNTLEQTAEPSGAPMPAELVSGALSHRPQPMV